MMVNEKDGAFYSRQSVITDPKQYTNELDALPDDAEKLLRTVQGLIIHGALGELYGINFSKRPSNEESLRTVPQMLEAIFRLDNRPLAAAKGFA